MQARMAVGEEGGDRPSAGFHEYDHYAVIGAPDTASDAEIRAAVRRALVIWTKRLGLTGDDQRREAEKRVRAIDEAEAALTDPRERAHIDLVEAQGRHPRPGPPPYDASVGWKSQARELLRSGNLRSARRAAGQAVGHDPTDDESWWLYGHSSFMLGDAAAAENELRQAVRIRPRNAEYHFALGEVYALADNWAMALSCYQEAVLLGADHDPVLLTARAAAEINLDEPKTAARTLDRLAEALPGVGWLDYYRAWAIDATAVSNWERVGGRQVIASETQATATLAACDMALGLPFTDTALRREIEAHRQAAIDATAIRWGRSEHVLWYRTAAATGLCLATAIFASVAVGCLGFLIVIGTAMTYWVRHRVPGWLVAARALGPVDRQKARPS